MKVLRGDLASFTGAGYGSVRIPKGVQVEPGELIQITDDEADTLEAEVLSVGDDTVEVRVHWDRPRVPTFDLELSPVARQTGATFLHDVYLNADQQLAIGDRVLVRDEGGHLWDAVVTGRVEVRLGHKYALQIQRSSPR